MTDTNQDHINKMDPRVDTIFESGSSSESVSRSKSESEPKSSSSSSSRSISGSISGSISESRSESGSNDDSNIDTESRSSESVEIPNTNITTSIPKPLITEQNIPKPAITNPTLSYRVNRTQNNTATATVPAPAAFRQNVQNTRPNSNVRNEKSNGRNYRRICMILLVSCGAWYAYNYLL